MVLVNPVNEAGDLGEPALNDHLVSSKDAVELAFIVIEVVLSDVYLVVFQVVTMGEEEPIDSRKQLAEDEVVRVNETVIHEKRVLDTVLFNLYQETKERDTVLCVVFKLLSSMLDYRKLQVVTNKVSVL